MVHLNVTQQHKNRIATDQHASHFRTFHFLTVLASLLLQISLHSCLARIFTSSEPSGDLCNFAAAFLRRLSVRVLMLHTSEYPNRIACSISSSASVRLGLRTGPFLGRCCLVLGGVVGERVEGEGAFGRMYRVSSGAGVRTVWHGQDVPTDTSCVILSYCVYSILA